MELVSRYPQGGDRPSSVVSECFFKYILTYLPYLKVLRTLHFYLGLCFV